jgi:hypothetical protein
MKGGMGKSVVGRVGIGGEREIGDESGIGIGIEGGIG